MYVNGPALLEDQRRERRFRGAGRSHRRCLRRSLQVHPAHQILAIVSSIGRPTNAMDHTINGACHCRNLSFELSTRTPVQDIRARACDCSFCRIHAAKNWSDPEGSVTIRIADERNWQKYRFALQTADFYICRVCGAYLGAILADDEGTWSTVNLRLSALAVGEENASYGAEDTIDRIQRRKRVWTPTTIIAGH